MGKEAGERGQQTEMQRTILELEAKNDALGGVLFATFGRGKSKALIFPTPHTIQENGISVADQLLVATNSDFMAIHFDRERKGIEVRSISTIVTEKFGKKDGFLNGIAGYVNGKLELGNFDISRKRIHDRRDADPFWGLGGQFYNNCRLVEVDRARVEEILAANVKRVEATRATS